MKTKLTTLELTYSAIFIGLMAIGANLTFWFPFLAIPIAGASVPVSLQTLFSILAGLLLGKRVGTFSMIGYILIGLMGVPVFVQMQGGAFVLFSPTGGFLISFIFVAYITGYLKEKTEKTSTSINLYISIIGVLINYVIGVSYMYLAMNTWLGLEINYLTAWIGMVPFFIKDIGLGIGISVVLNQLSNRLSLRINKI